jgi:transcriptional regulator with GAF, ATPase, and Fis domain
MGKGDRTADYPPVVVISHDLKRRATRSADPVAENATLLSLAASMAAPTEQAFQALAEATLRVCGADASGISWLEPEHGICRWEACAGTLAGNVGGIMLANRGPVRVVLEHQQAELFACPAGLRPMVLAGTDPFGAEALVAPLGTDAGPIGTLWAITHTPGHFDQEDCRRLTNMAGFCSAGYQLSRQLRRERLRREEMDRKLRERSRELWQARLALDL